MVWELTSWLVVMRAFQIAAALVGATMNGFVTATIYRNGHLGLTKSMLIPELLICMTLVYTTLAVFIQHSGQRSKKTSWLVTFIVGDIIFCGVDLAIITLLANAGLPSHCGGLATAKKYDDDDHKVYKPRPGFTTPGFTSGYDGQKGELDRFCAFERSYYAIALGLVFTYLATVILTVLRVFERSYTKTSRCIEVMNSLERADTMESKLSDTSSPVIEAPRSQHPDRSGPSSEGVITRTASIHSNVTGMTSSTTGNGPYLSGAIRPPSAIPASQNRNTSVPSRQLSVSTVSSNNTSRPGGAPSFAPVSPIDEGEIDIGATLVADGPQYRAQNNNIPHQQYQSNQQYQPPHHQRNLTQGTLPPLAENDILNPEVALLADGPQYRPNNQQQPIHSHQQPIHSHQQQQPYQNLYAFPRNVPLLPQGAPLPTPVKGDYLALASDGAADGRRYPGIQRSLSQQQPQSLSVHIPGLQGTTPSMTGGNSGKSDYLSLAADGSNDTSQQYPLIQRRASLLQHQHNLSLAQSPLPPMPGTNFIYPDIPTDPRSESVTPTPTNMRNINTTMINPNYAPGSTTGLNLELRFDGTGRNPGNANEPPSPDRYSISMSDVSSVSTALPPYQRYETGHEPQTNSRGSAS